VNDKVKLWHVALLVLIVLVLISMLTEGAT